MEKHDIKKPEPFLYNENNDSVEKIRSEWKIWKTKFKSYVGLLSSYNSSYNSKTKVSKLFLDTVGKQSNKILNSKGYVNESDIDILLFVLDETFDPPISKSEAREKFFSSKIKHYESWKDFADRLRKIVQFCNFGEEADKYMMDLMIQNMNDKLKNLISLSKPSSLSEFLKICNRYVKWDNELEKSLANIPDKDPSTIKCKFGLKCAKKSCKYLHAAKCCKFDPDCTVLNCQYNHDLQNKSETDTDETDNDDSCDESKMTERCKFGKNCRNKNCLFSHGLEDCKFYPRCTSSNCQYYHPHNGSKTIFNNHEENSSEEEEKLEICIYNVKCTNEKCKYLHVSEKCRYYPNCTKTDCKYFHDPQEFNGSIKKEKKTEKCKYGVNCKKKNCNFVHVEEKCKFYPKCIPTEWKYSYPKDAGSSNGFRGLKGSFKDKIAVNPPPAKNASLPSRKKKQNKKGALKSVDPHSIIGSQN